jgi:hypothetical protein
MTAEFLREWIQAQGTISEAFSSCTEDVFKDCCRTDYAGACGFAYPSWKMSAREFGRET